MPTLSDLIASVANIGDAPVWNGTGFGLGYNEMAERGFLAWSCPPAGGSTLIATTQNEIAVRIPLIKAISTTSVSVSVAVAGSTLTSGQNLLTLYRADGTLVGQTADQSGVWNTAGTYQAAWASGPFTVSGLYCWVGVLSNGTTPATFRCGSSPSSYANVAGIAGGVLAGASLRAGRIGAAVTAPATFTPANLVTTNAFQAFVALS